MALYKGSEPVAGLAKNTIVTGFNVFDCKWSDHIINDIQWLRADNFSWQSGDVYTTAYNKLVEEYATGTSVTEGGITFKRTTNGFKIADASQEANILAKYNSDGIAWYYILDAENRRFKLPRLKYRYWKNVSLNKPSTLPVKGNGMTIGVTNGSTNYGLSCYTSPAALGGYSGTYGRSAGSSNSGTIMSTGKSYGLTTDDSKSGIVADTSSLSVSNSIDETGFYLYFYVGEYAREAIEQTAGLNAELFNGKADVNTPSIQAPYLKTTYVNGTSGYNIWSNGYCEQWGIANFSSSKVTVSLLKTFLNTNYLVIGSRGGANATINIPESNAEKTVNSFTFYSSTTGGITCWKASGYLAEGQY